MLIFQSLDFGARSKEISSGCWVGICSFTRNRDIRLRKEERSMFSPPAHDLPEKSTSRTTYLSFSWMIFVEFTEFSKSWKSSKLVSWPGISYILRLNSENKNSITTSGWVSIQCGEWRYIPTQKFCCQYWKCNCVQIVSASGNIPHLDFSEFIKEFIKEKIHSCTLFR